MRRVTDKRSPVQPHRTSAMPFVIAGLVLAAIGWTLRDAWIDPLDDPAPTQTAEPGPAQNSDRPSSPPLPPGTSSLPSSDRGRASARANLAGLFSPDDYPADALARGEQGTASVTISIDEKGRVDGCSIRQSSGSRSLDSATCAIIERRAQFQPALHGDGRPTRSTYTQRITWRLQD